MSRFIVVDKSAVVFENEMAMVKFPDYQRALDAIQRVRELHKTDEPYWGATDARSVTADKLITPCYNCGQEYPCDTIKALDSEQIDPDRLIAINQQEDADR